MAAEGNEATAAADDSPQTGPQNGSSERDTTEQEKGISVRHLALYSGLFVLALQLLFVHTFFPTYDDAVATLRGDESAWAGGEAEEESAARDATPDFLQWSGAHSLVWLASLFVPETPVRHVPAIFFFLIMGGFIASMYRPPHPGGVLSTVLVSARNGILIWVSWLAGAVILLIYLLTSSGGLEALDVTAGITFDKKWEVIAETFMAHWLVYVAWFAFLAILPMVGGGLLGLMRTRLLTRQVPAPEAD